MKENEQIELKKNVSALKEALKSISAILNKHKSGILYFGINPNGEPIKTDISEKTLRDISQKIAEKIEPKIFHKGRGIALIREKEPDADFTQIGDLFITTLRRADYKVPKELVEGLAENQKEIVSFVFENPKISKRELADKLQISTTAVDKNIDKLKKMNILQRIGPAKGGQWVINEKKI